MELSNLYRYDRAIESIHGKLVGTDEAGRGPLAGPVVAAAVILDTDKPIEGINDSKILTEKRREALFPIICNEAIDVAATVVFPETIDEINILQASLQGMLHSIQKIRSPWNYILIDGNQKIKQLPIDQQRTVVKGDAKSASIAAASVIAKVVRDRLMRYYDKKYPEYGFAKHKGYPTKLHREQILRLGLTSIHRQSFCTHLVGQTSLFE